MNWKSTLFSIAVFCCSNALLGQSEFYVVGNVKVRLDAGTTPVLYVKGSITNDSSIFHNNASIIELTGNWTNIVGTGATPGRYESTGIERFSGTTNSIVDGNMNGIALINNFYNLKINKTDAADYVSLDTNTNVKNTLAFETNGIVRTDIVSYGDDGDLYTRELYVLSNASGAITGAAVAANEGTKYVEGKLRRQVAIGNYFYPIGIEPGIVDAGSQPIEFTFTAAANAGVITYFKDGATALIDTDVFSDVGTDPVQNQVNDLSDCIGGLDGIDDHIILDVHQAHEWVATPNTGTTFQYSVTVYPSPTADVNALAPNVPCANTALRYLAKTGSVGGLAVVSGAPIWTLLNGYDTAPTGYTISGQSGLSIFRLHTISSAAQGELGESLLELLGDVLLQGPYNAGTDLMDLGLNPNGNAGILPSTDPYGLGVTATVNPNAVDGIVDWIKIEVRNATTPTIILKEIAAFVKSDGTIVGLDGVTTLIGLGSLVPASYHIAIRHRNHLGIRTNTAVNFGSGSGSVDFTATSPAHGVFGTAARVAVEPGIWAMWGGEANIDGFVYDASDPAGDVQWILINTLGGDPNAFLLDVYNQGDVNMDGFVYDAGDPLGDVQWILINVLGGDPNNSVAQQLP